MIELRAARSAVPRCGPAGLGKARSAIATSGCLDPKRGGAQVAKSRRLLTKYSPMGAPYHVGGHPPSLVRHLEVACALDLHRLLQATPASKSTRVVRVGIENTWARVQTDMGLLCSSLSLKDELTGSCRVQERGSSGGVAITGPTGRRRPAGGPRGP